jgi:DNA-binding transcriptional LysR family regulator
VINWDDLKYLLAVARNGSTLAAGKVLGTSQSTVQRRLDALERQLGRQLVARHQTGYRLTELGKRMQAYAEGVEQAVAAFERGLAASDDKITGSVRVTCPEAVGYRLMRSPLIETFNQRYPELRVEFIMSDRLLDLAKGEADVAIRVAPSPERNLFGRKIAESPWALYASRSYVKRHRQIEQLSDINRHAIIKFEGALATVRAAGWLHSVAPNAKVAARSSNVPALLLAVKSGAGVAPMPTVVGDSESDLVRILGPLPELTTPFYLLIHDDMKNTPRVRAFFDFLIEHLKLIRPMLTGETISQPNV